MTKRYLTFHRLEPAGNAVRMSPSAYYIDEDSKPVAVRIYAEDAPLGDMEVDIFDDGTSIFTDNASYSFNLTTGVTSGTANTKVLLVKGENGEEFAENFAEGTVIEEGSWVWCVLEKANGAKNVTVQLELESMSEDI